MLSLAPLPNRKLYRLVPVASLPLALIFILLGLLPGPAHADSVIYVDAGATGAATGLSWTDAFTNVQDALTIAASADQIWVAEGVYYPDEGGGQPTDVLTTTFTLANGVALYGGFNGTETELSQRDPAIHITVLSGDIDKNDLTDPNGVVTNTANIAGANAYHVVTGVGIDNTTVLDGFTITAGQAVFPHDRGGGLQNQNSSPVLNSLIFRGNRADNSGGGVYNDSSSPSLTGVTFSGNSAGSRGGGMANNNGSAPALTGVIFISNTAFSGGGMHNGNSSPPSLNSITFSGNMAGYGGGMYNSFSSPNLIQVTFSGNNADVDGGGMVNNGSSPTLTDVTFNGNSAVGDGGGMFNDDSNPALIDVIFSGNGGTYGGGMRNQGGMPILTGVIFTSNGANSGGGMNNLNSMPALTNVIFSGNSANHNGGGMDNRNSSPSLSNVIFSGNNASGNGGGINSGNNSDAILMNVSFSGNSASGNGGAMANNFSNPALTNIIMWDDTASANPEIYNDSATPVIAYSNVQGCGSSNSWNTACGTDDGSNIDAHPLFVDPDGADNILGTLDDDLRLSAGSPAIDNGDNNRCPANDLDSMLRPIDGDGDGQAICDIGAFEYHIPTVTAVLSDEPDPSAPGQPFTVTVSVTATLGNPTGTVTVTMTGDPGLCGTTLTNGIGSCSLTLLASGTYTLHVAYAGNGTFGPSSVTERHTVEVSNFDLYLPIIQRDWAATSGKR